MSRKLTGLAASAGVASVSEISRNVERVNRVAMLSIHTSPLEQPGTGDAGGLNVYVVQLSRQLAQLGINVEIFTRATNSHTPPVTELDERIIVRHLESGVFEGLKKEDLPAQLCSLSSGVLRAEANRPPGWYDVIHSHYWLSGQVGFVASERWDVPLIHSMHTLAKVKNQALAEGDTPEPQLRVHGEQIVVDTADRIVANTVDERNELIELYGADPHRVSVVHPGVDLENFGPGDPATARDALGVRADAELLVFVGRIQPLKAPDVLVKAVAELVAVNPERRHRLQLVICGGPSGAGMERLHALEQLAVDLGVDDLVRFIPPADHPTLATWFQAADLVCVPSHSESFGLVAVEAQACGTPVVATDVGGLRTTVANGTSGILIDNHRPRDWAHAIAGLLDDRKKLVKLSTGALAHARQFSWHDTARRTLEVYRDAVSDRQKLQRSVG